MNNQRSPLLFMVLVGDALLGIALYGLFLLFLGGGNISKASYIIVGITYCFIIFSGGTILSKRNTRKWQIPLLILKNTAKFAVLSLILLYVSNLRVLSGGEMLCFYLAQFATSSVYRLAIYKFVKIYRSKDSHCHKVILLGSTSNNVELYDEMRRNPYWGYKVVGYFDRVENKDSFPDCPYLGTPERVVGYLSENKDIHELYCCLPSRDKEIIVPIIHFCLNNMVNFYSVPNLRNYLYNRVYFNMMGNVPYLSLNVNPLANVNKRLVKRGFDVIFSLLFLCTLFPLFFIVVVVITKTTMPGPIFFKQKRNGLNGKPFNCLKFRSMKVNTDSDSLQATKDDPRKTKWGNIMRKTSIDELPQFINVLLGDMSIVGPRPHMEKHTDEYSKLIDKYMMRHLVKPGITGWSQVTGYRGETKEPWQMEGRVKGDVWYIEHWSMGLDLLIIYKTIVNAVKGDKKAY